MLVTQQKVTIVLFISYSVGALERKIDKQEKIIAILKTVPCTVHAPLKEQLNALEALHSE